MLEGRRSYCPQNMVSADKESKIFSYGGKWLSELNQLTHFIFSFSSEFKGEVKENMAFEEDISQQDIS